MKNQPRRKIKFTVKSFTNPEDFGKWHQVLAVVYRYVKDCTEAGWYVEADAEGGWWTEAQEPLYASAPDAWAWTTGEVLAFGGMPPSSGPLYDQAIARLIRRMKRHLVKSLKTARSQQGAGI